MTLLLSDGGPCRKLQYALLISFTSFLALTSAASHRACYLPNGTEAISNVDIEPYLPCSSNKPHSMCCRTNSTDTCNSDGLCESSWDGNLWRDFCTDPTWQAPACTKLCLGSLGTDGDGKTGGSVRVTQCSNGSYCCGVGSNANECCNTGSGVWIARNGQTTDVNPASATTGAAAQSSTSSTTQATSTTQTSSTAQGATPVPVTSPSPTSSSSSSKSSTPTGAIAGGVVGGVVAIALIALAVLLLRRRRKNERLANEKHNHDAYAQGVMHKQQQQQPQMYGEMDGQNAKVEMEGSRVGHEMGAQGYYNPKGNQPVHELQS